MKIIFIRHAHRDTEVRSQDNGLSEKGQKQVKALREYFIDDFLKKQITESERAQLLVFSSPKKRCLETIRPLALKGEFELQIDDRIDEQHSGLESGTSFAKLVEGFLDELIYQNAPVVVICSHGDWIPEAVHHLTGAVVSVKKAGWCELESLGKTWVITALFRN